jgi:long-subunit acyl-CoA synthetase (AMP-forming)
LLEVVLHGSKEKNIRSSNNQSQKHELLHLLPNHHLQETTTQALLLLASRQELNGGFCSPSENKSKWWSYSPRSEAARPAAWERTGKRLLQKLTGSTPEQQLVLK